MADTNVVEKREGSTLNEADNVAPVASQKEIVADGEAGPVAPVAPTPFTVPDGGLEAWLVVVGGWLVLFATFGYINAFGVYEAYYITALDKSASAIAWIGSFQLWLQFSMGLFVGKLFDEGHGRLLLLVGSVIYLISIFMTSLCKTYWQVFLGQGVAGGIGLGIMFLPVLGVIPHWFQRKRALATGIVVSGSSVGGICFPIMLNNLFTSIGYADAVRASGYLLLGCLVIANFLVKPRIPGRSKRPAHMQFPAPNMKAIITHDAYLLTIAGGFLIMWGIFLPLFYIQVFAESRGVSENLAFYSLSIINAASVLGRTLPNMLADKLGVFNMLIVASLCAGIVLFGWLPAHSSGGIIVFCLLFGFFSGAYVSILPGCFAALSSHVGEIGVRMGLAWAIIALAALSGTPICGALLGPELTWWKPTVFAGISTIVGAFIMLFARGLQAKAKGTWKV